MDNNLNLLVDAKNAYTSELKSILTPQLYEGIESLYNDSLSQKNKNNRFKIFQLLLKEIPKWNQDIIDNETNRILKMTNCDYIDKLVSAVFISNTRILTSVNIKNSMNTIEISIPKLNHFIHKCYIEIAREFYKNPFLLNKKISSKERQNNLRESISCVNNSIDNAIRKLLPIKEILNQYLVDDIKSIDKNLLDNNEINEKFKSTK